MLSSNTFGERIGAAQALSSAEHQRQGDPWTEEDTGYVADKKHERTEKDRRDRDGTAPCCRHACNDALDDHAHLHACMHLVGVHRSIIVVPALQLLASSWLAKSSRLSDSLSPFVLPPTTPARMLVSAQRERERREHAMHRPCRRIYACIWIGGASSYRAVPYVYAVMSCGHDARACRS